MLFCLTLLVCAGGRRGRTRRALVSFISVAEEWALCSGSTSSPMNFIPGMIVASWNLSPGTSRTYALSGLFAYNPCPVWKIYVSLGFWTTFLAAEWQSATYRLVLPPFWALLDFKAWLASHEVWNWYAIQLLPQFTFVMRPPPSLNRSPFIWDIQLALPQASPWWAGCHSLLNKLMAQNHGSHPCPTLL